MTRRHALLSGITSLFAPLLAKGAPKVPVPVTANELAATLPEQMGKWAGEHYETQEHYLMIVNPRGGVDFIAYRPQPESLAITITKRP